MIDEQQVREILRRRADSVNATPTDRAGAIRRAHRRLARTTTVALLAAAAIVVGASIGLRALDLAYRETPTDTPEPIVPKANGEIAFIAAGRLAVVQPDGSGLHPLLASTQCGDCEITQYGWSPDGGRLAFMATHSEGSDADLYVVNADGSSFRRLAGCSSCAPGAVAWSPDGSRIAFPDGGSVYAVDADGGGLQRLCQSCSDLAWSPDGSRVAFSRGRALYVMSGDGSGLRALTDAFGAIQPVWSPDGTRIVFTAPYGVYVTHVDGSKSARLLWRGKGQGPVAPSWSPDGSRIVYLNAPPFDYPWHVVAEVYVVNADGTGTHRLYRSVCCITEWSPPIWSPDARFIALSLQLDGSQPGEGGLLLLSADGNGVRTLTTSGRAPAWQAIP